MKEQGKHQGVWDAYISYASQMLSEGNCDKAALAARLALDDVLKFKELTPRLAACIYTVTSRCCAQDKYTEANQLFTRLVDVKCHLAAAQSGSVTGLERAVLHQVNRKRRAVMAAS